MHFDETDVWQMIRDLDYLRIAKIRSAKVFIQKLVTDASELKPALQQYPSVRFEQLDYFYLLLKYLAAVSPGLLSDLTSGQYTWRGIVIASWLACLKPNNEFQSALLPAEHLAPPENVWFVQLATAEISGSVWQGNPDLQNLVRALRESLDQIKPPTYSLRLAPTTAELEQWKAAQTKILAAYKQGGLTAAKMAMQDTSYAHQIEGRKAHPNPSFNGTPNGAR